MTQDVTLASSGFRSKSITLFERFKMKADKWIFLLPLLLIFVSSQELGAQLGSSVLLPCNSIKSNFSEVKWVQIKEMEDEVAVVEFSSDGLLKFRGPRHGRVKAFPIQASQGNYSIRIDDLRPTDLGVYQCQFRDTFFEVELYEEKDELPVIYIFAGVAGALLLLCCLGGYYLQKTCCSGKKTQGNANDPAISSIEGASAPPQELEPVNDEHRIDPAGGDFHVLVYENDDQYLACADPNRSHVGLPRGSQHPGVPQPGQSTGGIYPNLNELRFERVESQRTRQRFHIDLISRLRQASFNRHFYVNQRELSKSHAMATRPENGKAGMGRKKAKDSFDYKNPIYNRGTVELNQL
ncbi:uncharacterized protein ACNS7B_015169 isoform 1-T1 [Menidia menidia]